jgi:PST family polysaccharide transporter
MKAGSLKRIVLRNTGVQLATQAAGVVFGLVTTLVLSRYLGVERFGEFNYLFAFYYFFLTASDFGVTTIVIREASQRRDQMSELMGALLTLKLLTAGACMLVAWAAILIMGFPPALRMALLAFSFIVPLIALQFPLIVFHVLLRQDRAAIIGIGARAAGFGLTMLAVWLNGGLPAIIASVLFTEALLAALGWIFSRRHVSIRLRVDVALWKHVLGCSVPLGAAMLCVAVINRIDFVMLERMTDLRQVGLYAAAYKVTHLLESLPLVVMSSVYPLMAGYAVTDPLRLRRIYRQSVLALAAIGLPLGLGVMVGAPLIVRFLFGPAFTEVGPILAVLVWASVFLYVALSGGNLLISTGRERVSLALNMAAAALNVGLNLLLIPRFGPVGAAAATSATYLFLMVGIAAASERALAAENQRRPAASPPITDAALVPRDLS